MLLNPTAIYWTDTLIKYPIISFLIQWMTTIGLGWQWLLENGTKYKIFMTSVSRGLISSGEIEALRGMKFLPNNIQLAILDQTQHGVFNSDTNQIYPSRNMSLRYPSLVTRNILWDDLNRRHFCHGMNKYQHNITGVLSNYENAIFRLYKASSSSVNRSWVKTKHNLTLVAIIQYSSDEIL